MHAVTCGVHVWIACSPVQLQFKKCVCVCVCAVVHVVRVNIEIWWISVCSIPHLGYYVFAYWIIYHLLCVNWCTCVSVFLSLSLDLLFLLLPTVSPAALLVANNDRIFYIQVNENNYIGSSLQSQPQLDFLNLSSSTATVKGKSYNNEIALVWLWNLNSCFPQWLKCWKYFYN